MTTQWTPSNEWAGETVAVLGNAPTLLADLEQLPEGCRVIAANRAALAYPMADMMVAIDGDEPPPDFTGLYVVGNESGRPGLYCGVQYERAVLEDGSVTEFRNNGCLALRLAARMGAARILIIAFDVKRYERVSYPGVQTAFDRLVADLRASGIVIEHVVSRSDEDDNDSVRCIPLTNPMAVVAPRVDADVTNAPDVDIGELKFHSDGQ